MRAARLGGLLALVAASLVTAPPARPQADPACDHSVVPFAWLAGAGLVPEDHVSKDDPPVHYTRWRGTVPGFDGMPFSVDVTVPCGAELPLPLVAMNHGFIDDKTVWQETGKSDRVVSEERPQTNSEWNNIWFASRGYAVLNHTARGWRDSCGPDVPGAVRGVAPAPQCLPYQYWIHLADKRWEVRDIQWLVGGLVQSGVADANRLAVTGGSYGGAPTASAALLGSRTMCGAVPVPADLGPDPCAGKADQELVPWATPDGSTALNWAAALPLITFADLAQVLTPNGRNSDGDHGAPPDGDSTDPVGVPLQSHLAGLLAAGQANGYFAPPGVDPTSDIFVDSARILAGNPFPQDDPVLARAARVYQELKSPITISPVDRVPVFWVQGFTDPLFTALHPLRVVRMVRAVDPAYPIKVFLGDIGHDYTGQRHDEWELARSHMNAFLDHYLAGRGPEPSFDVGGTVTRCLDHDAPMRYAAAPDWSGLHPIAVTLTSDEVGVTNSATPGPAALATDPVTTATLPLPGSYLGCRKMSPSEPDPTAATYLFDVGDDLVLMGGPVVEIDYATTAPDTELNVRLWDVAPDASVQGLVTRGTYRSLDGPGQGLSARFQLAPNSYRFPAGHQVKLEVAANDAPFHQASNIPAVVQVEGISLTLPLLERGTSLPIDPRPAAPASGRGSHPATGGEGPALAAGLVLAGALALRRLVRPLR